MKLTKGVQYPFVDMKSLNPACREVIPNEIRTFGGGGARFLPEDTLLARITPCLENGKIAHYKPIGENSEAFGSTEFIVIRGKNGVTDNDFVYYLTIWPEFREFAISQMTGSSGRQRVPVGSLAGFTFNLPPLPEQKSLPNDVRRLFPSEFEHSEEIGWIPKEWRVSTIGDEFDVIMRQSPPSSTYNEEDEGIPFFQGSSDFSFRYSRKRIYCSAPKRVAEKNYSLVSVRAPVGDLNMALEKCCIGRGLAALIHKSSSRSFTYYSMLKLKNNFKSFDSDGTVFGSITKKDLKSLKCIRFNYLLIKEFEKFIGRFDEKIRVLYESIITLKSLRDTILFKLLSGEVRIEKNNKPVEKLK